MGNFQTFTVILLKEKEKKERKARTNRRSRKNPKKVAQEGGESAPP